MSEEEIGEIIELGGLLETLQQAEEAEEYS